MTANGHHSWNISVAQQIHLSVLKTYYCNVYTFTETNLNIEDNFVSDSDTLLAAMVVIQIQLQMMMYFSRCRRRGGI